MIDVTVETRRSQVLLLLLYQAGQALRREHAVSLQPRANVVQHFEQLNLVILPEVELRLDENVHREAFELNFYRGPDLHSYLLDVHEQVHIQAKWHPHEDVRVLHDREDRARSRRELIAPKHQL